MRPIAGSDSYRAPQPSRGDLETAAQRGVKSVVCLRKGHEGERWYDEQMATCRELGLEMRTLDWSSRDSSQDQIDRLIHAFEELPPPYLIHCQHGVDRTGLAAAVYRVVCLGHSKRASKDELSVWNLHLPWFGAEAMDKAWRKFHWPRPQLAQNIHNDAPAAK